MLSLHSSKLLTNIVCWSDISLKFNELGLCQCIKVFSGKCLYFVKPILTILIHLITTYLLLILIFKC